MSLAPIEESLWRETVLQEKLKNPLFRSMHAHAKKDKNQGHSQHPFPQTGVYLFHFYGFIRLFSIGGSTSAEQVLRDEVICEFPMHTLKHMHGANDGAITKLPNLHSELNVWGAALISSFAPPPLSFFSPPSHRDD